MLKILHILPNEKFSPINVFELTDSDNLYLCELLGEDDEVLYLDKDKVVGCRYSKILEFVKSGNYDVVIFHSLQIAWYDLVLAVPKYKKVVWALWGFDFYSTEKAYAFVKKKLVLYKTLTKQWLDSVTPKMEILPLPIRLKRWIKLNVVKNPLTIEQYQRMRQEEKKDWDYFFDVIGRIDYVAPIYDVEIDYLKLIPGFRASYFPMQYSHWSKHDVYDELNLSDANYILLNNSSDYMGNHLDVIRLLKKRGIANTVYMPMVYGDSGYEKTVADYCQQNGVKRIIQNDMIPYDEYCKVISNSRVAIFGHIRQQASDTIHICLLRGCKVFLYKDSVGYEYFKRKGYFVYTIEKDLTPENIQTLLTKEQVNHNRELVMSTVSIESVADKLQKSLYEL